jgi:hypothetical protein
MSSSPVLDHLAERQTAPKAMSGAEFPDPCDGFARGPFPGRFDGSKNRHGNSMLLDDNAFSPGNPGKKFGQMSFGFESADLLHEDLLPTSLKPV